MRTMSEIFERHKNKFTRMWSIDIDHWRNNLDYFGEALAICEEFDLIKLMTVNCDFDVQLIISSMLQSTSALMRSATSPLCAVMSSFMSHGELSAMHLAMRIPGRRVKEVTVLTTDLNLWIR